MRQFGLIDMFGWTALYAAWFAVWPWSGIGPWIMIVWSLLIAGTITLLKLFNQRSAALFAVFSVGGLVWLSIFLSLALSSVPHFSIFDMALAALIASVFAASTIGPVLWLSVIAADRLITHIKRKLSPASTSQ